MVALAIVLLSPRCIRAEEKAPPPSPLDIVLANTKPLKFPRGDRLPFYVLALTDIPFADDAEGERILKELDSRGIAAIADWSPGAREQSLAYPLRLARLQKKLGLEVVVNATGCLSSFFDGSPETAHIDIKGKPFFDTSFGNPHMGCPFGLEGRIAPIRAQIEPFLDAYKKEGIDIGFVFADWEIDGPIEWNGAWDASKGCIRCRERVPNIDDFAEFQKSLRTIRARLQKECFATPVLARFPKAKVGNYGVYPLHDLRFWYDYYETLPTGAPFRAEQDAKYRYWYNEFPLTGYTCAMPVVYTWYPIFGWYDFKNPDSRWFYNLLLNGSESARAAGGVTPSIPFIHWHTTSPPEHPDPSVMQFSAEKYQELLWHLLLRGQRTFFLWCMPDELGEEVRLAHEVYAASLEYRDFLDRGLPIHGDPIGGVPTEVSAVRLGNKVLVRRTDFRDVDSQLTLFVGETKGIAVPKVPGACQVLEVTNASN